MEPDKECFAIGKAHSRAWYSAGLSDGRRDEHDGHNRRNRNQHEFPALHHDGEAVVVGYGTQKKVSLTGSISNVGTEDLKSMPVSSVTNALGTASRD